MFTENVWDKREKIESAMMPRFLVSASGKMELPTAEMGDTAQSRLWERTYQIKFEIHLDV